MWAKPYLEKFRTQGISKELMAKYDILFLDIVATGEHAWAPSSGIAVDDDFNVDVADDIEAIENVAKDDTINLEGSGDSEEEPNFFDSLNNMVRSNMGDVSSSEKMKNKKSKRVDESSKHEKLGNKMKKIKSQSTGSAKLSQQIDRLVTTVESQGTVTSKRTDLPGCMSN